MDMLQESSLLVDEEIRGKVQDTEWNACQTPDRRHADALLNISEDSFAKDEDAYELSIESGWEEAIQGWGRSPPLACLFQIQKKSRKSKAADGDYHCLLCIDVKHLRHAESEHSTHSLFDSEGNGSSDQHHHCEGSKCPLVCLKSLAKHPSNVSPSVTEHHTCKETMKQALCGDEAFLEASRLTLVETFPESANTHHLDSQCAKMPEKDRNVSAIMNSFNVLPPVKAQGASDQQSPALRGTEGTENKSAAHGISDGPGLHGTLGTGERAGVEKICEFIQAGMASDVPEARCGTFPSEHQGLSGLRWSPQPRKHLRFALGIQNAKKRDPPLNIVGDLFPRTGYRLVRNIKYEDLSRVSVRNTHGHRLYIALKARSITETDSQLPALLGTRVPLPASSHRLL
ncbi:uncharacterized protein si:ch73-103b9.2 isoform X2 [Anguilla rostrata]